MTLYLPIFADVGAKVLYLLYAWLLSAALSGEISKRKGFSEKAGLGTGLLLSVIGLAIWLCIPARTGFAGKGWRRFIPIGKGIAAKARQGATTK